jgi:hypothetical protein
MTIAGASAQIVSQATSWPSVHAGPGRRGELSLTVETDDDVRDVIALMRLNYDRIVEQHGFPAEAA